MAILLVAIPVFAQQRAASDFEIRQMQRQLATQRDFVSQLSGHLNLGDLRLARNERVLANAEYAKALDIANAERIDARKSSDLTRYATATSYAALADAKLAHDDDAFALAEEALRYTSDSAKTWNVYASTMTQIGKRAKAASASRNAVAIAAADVARTPSIANRLDLAIYQYALASALDDRAESEQLLQGVIASLKSDAFDPLKKSVVSHEAFEIYSSARGPEAAYVSLLNRSQLKLATLYEADRDVAKARAVYEDVLASRTDDPTALTALARLAPSEERFAAAFAANPFSPELVRDYQRWIASAKPPLAQGDTTGAKVRRAIQQIDAGELRAARVTLDALLAQFPSNDTLRMLRSQAEERDTGFPQLAASPTPEQLRQLIAVKTMTPEQRRELDTRTFTSTAVFASEPFESGTIEGVPFRFSEPTRFSGDFRAAVPLRLTYRILGATDVAGADGLLLEPIRVEAIR